MTKVLALKRPIKKGSPAAINAAAAAALEACEEHARVVFAKMPERYTFSLSLRSALFAEMR
jgi:Flp pilus assembly protein CpaB